jgi:hypothetical protein
MEIMALRGIGDIIALDERKSASGTRKNVE